MIKIICFGKIKEKYLLDAIDDYKKRLSKYTKVVIVELCDECDKNVDNALSREYDRVMKHISLKDNLVMLDLFGKSYTSVQFSNFIEKELVYSSNITFLIGSSNGFDRRLCDLVKKKVSFSSLTFPHGLFRVILLEQIYRGFKIINNETYHK